MSEIEDDSFIEWFEDIRFDLLKLEEDLEDTIEYLRTENVDDCMFNSILRKLKNIRNEFELDINPVDKFLKVQK